MKSAFAIVIAEDDEDDQLFIREALAKTAFKGTIDCVTDGSKLLHLLQNEWTGTPPGLILLDINMPVMDGYQALREIKQDTQLRHIPTVVLTASLNAADEQRCYALGADRFFRKPLSLQEYDLVAARIMDFMAAPEA